MKQHETIKTYIADSWKIIAPFWPLQNLIAVNPLGGLEDFPIEQAIQNGAAYFQRSDIPKGLLAVNRKTLKWCQAYFDTDQATLTMPKNPAGLFATWKDLARFDALLYHKNTIKDQKKWLKNLPASSEAAIMVCLEQLNIPEKDYVRFMRLILSSLSGWAGHVQYRAQWANKALMKDQPHDSIDYQSDYLAMRLAICCFLWPDAVSLLAWDDQKEQTSIYQNAVTLFPKLQQEELSYIQPLTQKLTEVLWHNPAPDPIKMIQTPKAQLVFCIDVRSEPFRRALESQGDYDTYGFAGFFGVPIQIHDQVTGDSYASCPVLLTPQHHVTQTPKSTDTLSRLSDTTHSLDSCAKTEHHHRGYKSLVALKGLYQSLKYNFATPFALVEILGALSGTWMAIRILFPNLASHWKKRAYQKVRPSIVNVVDIQSISLEDQKRYAYGALWMMGLTKNFAPLILLCGHGSSTENNPYATSLDCGACGGRHGDSNAKVLAAILNNPEIRAYLKEKEIIIPEESLFLAAQHNTTTDYVEIFDQAITNPVIKSKISDLQTDLHAARILNAQWRAGEMGFTINNDQAALNHVMQRSLDWAQVRPEWGLAGNNAFLIAPRAVTRHIDLKGKSFLHSYDWMSDPDSSALTTILTAPMVVAQWINSQYLFSSFDNVAYGSGSKITHNIVGKFGIMQGNASDLMTGLSLQSVYNSDQSAYHKPTRLTTMIYAPADKIGAVIAQQPILQKLFGNGWVNLICFDPEKQQVLRLERDLTWSFYA